MIGERVVDGTDESVQRILPRHYSIVVAVDPRNWLPLSIQAIDLACLRPKLSLVGVELSPPTLETGLETVFDV